MLLRTLLGMLFLASAVATASAAPYLFASFHGNGEDGLHLSSSHDGYHWTALRNDHSLLTPTVGSKLMRDPSIVQGPDGVFRMVWSSGWYDKGFGYSSSTDLIHWTAQQFIPVNASVANAQNTWAPDLFYDASRGRFQITWATSVASNGFSNRLYCTTTKDFKTFSAAQLLFDPGYNCIDGTIIKENGRYALVFKNENACRLQVSVGSDPMGSFGEPIDLPTNDSIVEGPAAINIGGDYLIYFDHYANGQYYGALRSSDFSTWVDVSGEMSFPTDTRHGSVFQVSQGVLNTLNGVPEPPPGVMIMCGVMAAAGGWARTRCRHFQDCTRWTRLVNSFLNRRSR